MFEKHSTLSSLAIVAVVVMVLGCGQSTADKHPGPRKAFDQWLAAVTTDDYRALWNLLPASAQQRYAMSWDKEREALEQAGPEDRERFVQVYGFQSFDQLQSESAEDFFVRSMGRYPNEGVPRKYEILQKASFHEVTYGDGGLSCLVTFLDEHGSPLPMKMKMVKEGTDWKVVRLP
jgi:hypothetical protein